MKPLIMRKRFMFLALLGALADSAEPISSSVRRAMLAASQLKRFRTGALACAREATSADPSQNPRASKLFATSLCLTVVTFQRFNDATRRQPLP